MRSSALYNLQVDKFADHLLEDFKVNDGLMAALVERYDRATTSGNLLDDAVWIMDLKKMLLLRAAEAPSPFGKNLERRLAVSFGKIEASFARARHHAATLAEALAAAIPQAEIAEPEGAKMKQDQSQDENTE